MRRGIRLGVDVGLRRVGLARSDRDGLMAVPIETCDRATAVERVRSLCEEFEPLEILVGLPLSLSGTDTPSTADAREFAQSLASVTSCDVRMVDERLSTVSAHTALRQAGKSQKTHRQVVDQVAAVILLQHALDSERAQGTPPGRVVE